MRRIFERTDRRSSLVLQLVLAPVAAGMVACATDRGAEQESRDVFQLAEKLVEAARQRVELSQMRVVVQGIHSLRPEPPAARTAANTARHEDPVGIALEHGFVIALAGRLNVVESEMVTPAIQLAPANTLSDVAATYGATHLLVGDYRRGKDELIVSVRLIDAESHIIVAAVVGRVAVPDLEAEPGPRRLAVVAPASPSTAIVYADEPIPGPAPSAGTPDARAGLDRTTNADVAAAVGPVAPSGGGSPTWSGAIRPAPAGNEQPRTAATEAPAPAQGVEDFETWRARHLAESVQASPPVSRENSSPPPARGAAATGIPASESFPWRRDSWLAQLLGIPAGTRPNSPH